MAMYKLNKADNISPKSLSGVSGVYTTNGSYFIALFNKFYFAEDKWRGNLILVTGDHYSQFFLDDSDGPGFYDFGTKTTIVSGGLQRKMFRGLYVGFSYMYAHYMTEYEDQNIPTSTTTLHGLELNLLHDTRNEVYYPTTGKKINLRWITNPEALGNELTANRIKSEYNQYFPMAEGRDVIGARFAGSFGLGNIIVEHQ